MGLKNDRVHRTQSRTTARPGHTAAAAWGLGLVWGTQQPSRAAHWCLPLHMVATHGGRHGPLGRRRADWDTRVRTACGRWSTVFKHGKSVHRGTKIVLQTNGRAGLSRPVAFYLRSLVPSFAVPSLTITSLNRNEPLPSTLREAKRLKQDKRGSTATT